MHESIIGRRYRERVEETLRGNGLARNLREPLHVEVLQATHDSHEGMGIGELWYRLSLASKFLTQEGWAEDEQWLVALGSEELLPDPTYLAPSIAQALVDLSCVVADRKAKGIAPMWRDHRMLRRCSIGLIDELCWELGTRTPRGKDVDERYHGSFFRLKTDQAS